MRDRKTPEIGAISQMDLCRRSIWVYSTQVSYGMIGNLKIGQWKSRYIYSKVIVY